ncbi:exported hypothetical protein [Candidatus Sulfopaludibacter sp. SbA4]|nr:exported hypothetical protein [Candidatus Sulfopaludibacter sp. SbA4]
MSRARRIAAIAAASVTGLVVVAIIAGIAVVQTDWFRNMVRTKIVAAVEESAGGRPRSARSHSTGIICARTYATSWSTAWNPPMPRLCSA